MENLFVWILIFAGAAIALLGVFLVASERELKKKRLEIEALLAKVSDDAAPKETPPVDLVESIDQEEVSRLMTINEDLQNQVNNQAAKLELARRTIDELETAAHGSGESQTEVDTLRAANARLSAEIDDLKGRLQLNGVRVSDFEFQIEQWAATERQLRQEISDLSEKLEESRNKPRELEDSQESLAQRKAMEAAYAEERQGFESRIADLGQELAQSREKYRDYDAVRERLAESERLQSELAEQNRRHDEEVGQWRVRAFEAEETTRRLAALAPTCDGLQVKYESLARQVQEFQSDFLAMSRLVTETVKANASDGALSAVAGLESLSVAPPAEGDSSPIASSAEETGQKSKRAFGIVALLLVGALGLLTYSTWNSPVDQAPAARTAFNAPAAAAFAVERTDSPSVPSVAAREREPAATARPQAALPETRAPLKTSAKTKPAPNVAGTYELIRSSHVYTAPSEFSTQIAEIEPGTKVQVVNGRDGWLEIRSKHGRPPGYIRTEAAARVTER